MPKNTKQNFNEEINELLKPLLKTILRENNINPKHNRKGVEAVIRELSKEFGYELEIIAKMKPYVMKLIDDLRTGAETLDK